MTSRGRNRRDHQPVPDWSAGGEPIFAPHLLNGALLFVTFTSMQASLKPARRKMRLLPLVAATYFMVSGGPYGIE
ncbi:MAG: hypothetical protein WBQ95_05525, partial [Terracidiphilus sp.]